jgi:hypothetical protein
MAAPPDPRELVLRRIERFVERLEADAAALRSVLSEVSDDGVREGLSDAYFIAHSVAEDAIALRDALERAGLGPGSGSDAEGV